MLSRTPLALALTTAWNLTPALAQPTADSADEVNRLNEITVSSTRTERRIDNVPATVSVTSRVQIEQSAPNNLKTLLRDELDVSIRTAPSRFTAAGSATGRAGNEGVNIRGLEGNQVLMTVDGIRLPNSFSFGAFATGRGEFVEIDSLKAAEVLRGPASTQFGSDGLAGAVSLRTLDPVDLLRKDQAIGGIAKLGHASVDHSSHAAAALAGRGERWQAMLLGSDRQGHETENRGDNDAQNSNRTTPNPLDYHHRYWLGKVQWVLTSEHQLAASAEWQRRNQDSEVYSARALAPLAASSVIDLDSRDRSQRDRLTLEHRYRDLNATWLQKVDTRLYWQHAEVSQFSIEDRYTAADRTRDNRYEQNVAGVASQFESHLATPLSQRLSYGFDWSRSTIRAERNGTVPPPGERFPSKPFPDTDYTLTGIFVQDEMEAGQLSIIPGLRLDHYQLTPSAHAYAAPLASLSDHALTPRLGMVWRHAPWLSPYAQWAQGFRAPTPDQVNNGFSNPASGYTTVGNAHLQAEHANSLEIGLRGRGDNWRYSIAAYHNRYRDFISQQVVGGAGTPANPTVFQYINLSSATIWGAELRGEWQPMSPLKLNAGLAYARGESDSRGMTTPLDTVQPLRALFGLRFEQDNWGASARLEYSAAKQRERIAPASPPAFATPSYTVLDLGIYWKPQPRLSIHAHLNNLFDRKYWRWSDSRGLADNSPIQDAYTAPGRNAQLSVRYDF
ncbi:TonB-dependent hemoglobin/transferrin/lactoferrin family receptor [Parachitinimonas caeni]|uniref:TonB-dependent hemoglobin/transferrin/lactoferrin family receptor n=1 Tax=Parachitinimonas caeni TaxID=3031301 RepID=A0ABT7DV60_9NEIS|nr:TonB-dependent hemoglobin/transferrin/lactoferrin family receptor [Parachitinimonas caeni]MDK2122978.1 TonB-dependent hemoglobin/transferrin/lactoferrin family receptor [Parachitinimonas caeni]